MTRRVVAMAAMAVGLAAAPADPVTWKLEAPAAVKAGARFEAKLRAAVRGGWHIYSLTPAADGPIATRIWVGEGQVFSAAGAVRAPGARVTQDASFGVEVETYEGGVEFGVPVKVAAEAEAGVRKLVVSARYQSCNQKICLAPKTVEVEAAVAIGK